MAFRVPGKDAVEDVVQGLAANKPQKLRQIGLNYDLAHAKAYSESEDKERVGKAKTEEKKEQPEGENEEPPEEEEEPPEEKKEGPPEGEKDSSVAAAPTSADTSASTSNDPTPASTTTPSTASPETKVQASEGPTDKEDVSSPPPAPTAPSEAAEPAEPAETSPPDSQSAPWNAVCVIGLRVYSKDAEVSVKLVKPRDAEEGAALDIDGVTPAGATT
jgi:hypothetical protein